MEEMVRLVVEALVEVMAVVEAYGNVEACVVDVAVKNGPVNPPYATRLLRKRPLPFASKIFPVVEVALVPIGYYKSAEVRAAADRLYGELAAAGIDVLIDDRDERPGVLFADMDLIGVPHRVVLSERGLAAGSAEYKGRRDDKPQDVASGDILSFLRGKLTPA